MSAAIEALDLKPARQRWLLRNALLLVACALAARLGAATAEEQRLVATFAPAIGVAWAAAMRWGPAVAPGAWLGLAVGMWWAGASLLLAVAIATGQCLGALVAAFWLGRAGFDARMEQPRDLWVWAGTVLCGGLVLSAANAASWLLLAGRIPLIDLAGTWLAWWFQARSPGWYWSAWRCSRCHAPGRAWLDPHNAGSAMPRCCSAWRCLWPWWSTRWSPAGSTCCPLRCCRWSRWPGSRCAADCCCPPLRSARWLCWLRWCMRARRGRCPSWSPRSACDRCGPAWQPRRRWCCWCTCLPAAPTTPRGATSWRWKAPTSASPNGHSAAASRTRHHAGAACLATSTAAAPPRSKAGWRG